MGNCCSKPVTRERSDSTELIVQTVTGTLNLSTEPAHITVETQSTAETGEIEFGTTSGNNEPVDNEHTTLSTLDEVPVESLSEYTPTTLTIDELKMRTEVSDNHLDEEIAEFDIFMLAGCFDQYKHYLDGLKLSSQQCEDLKREEFLYGQQSAMAEALRLWRRRDPDAAMYGALLNIALELGNGEVATKLCQYVVQNVKIVSPAETSKAATNRSISKRKLLQEQESLRQEVHEKNDRLQQLQRDLNRERASMKSEIEYHKKQIENLKDDHTTANEQLKQQLRVKDEKVLTKETQVREVQIDYMKQVQKLERDLLEAKSATTSTSAKIEQLREQIQRKEELLNGQQAKGN